MKGIWQSGKQRRAAIKWARVQRAARLQSLRCAAGPAHGLPVNRQAAQPDNSFGAPEFVDRGYYQDIAFCCVDCGAREIWTAERQKWWYETAKGGVWTVAKRCKACRMEKRRIRDHGRQTFFAGLQRKASKL